MISGIVDWILDLAYQLVGWALMLLPNSPFQSEGFVAALSSFDKIMGHINYFVPFGNMFAIMTTYIAAVVIWYIVRWVLRLAQYID